MIDALKPNKVLKDPRGLVYEAEQLGFGCDPQDGTGTEGWDLEGRGGATSYGGGEGEPPWKRGNLKVRYGCDSGYGCGQGKGGPILGSNIPLAGGAG